MDHDPLGALDQIKGRSLAINFADDELKPPELGALESAISKIPGGALRDVAGGTVDAGGMTARCTRRSGKVTWPASWPSCRIRDKR